MPAAGLQDGEELPAQQQGDQRPGGKEQQRTDAARRQGKPAFQIEGTDLEREITDGKDHGKNSSEIK